MASAGRRIQELVVYLVLIVIGIVVCAWWGPSQLGEARATANWPAAKGSVIEAHAVSQSGRRSRSHSVRISYSYKVGDSTYTGDRYSVTGNLRAGSEQQAEQLARGYRKGDEIPVYYDPASPERAVLVRGGVRKAWLTIGFGALLLVIGLGMGAWRLLRG